MVHSFAAVQYSIKQLLYARDYFRANPLAIVFVKIGGYQTQEFNKESWYQWFYTCLLQKMQRQNKPRGRKDCEEWFTECKRLANKVNTPRLSVRESESSFCRKIQKRLTHRFFSENETLNPPTMKRDFIGATRGILAARLTMGPETPKRPELYDRYGNLIEPGDLVKTQQYGGGILPPGEAVTGIAEEKLDAFGVKSLFIKFRKAGEGFDRFILLDGKINEIILA